MADVPRTTQHQHSWAERHGDIESCCCGASRVVTDAATAARREAATEAFKQRYNEALAPADALSEDECEAIGADGRDGRGWVTQSNLTEAERAALGGVKAIEFLRKWYPVIDTALSVAVEANGVPDAAATGGLADADRDWFDSLVNARVDLDDLDSYITGPKV